MKWPFFFVFEQIMLRKDIYWVISLDTSSCFEEKPTLFFTVGTTIGLLLGA